MRIVLAGALDTKGEEYEFLAGLLRDAGLEPLVVDVGTRGTPTTSPAVGREVIADLGGVRLGDADLSRAEMLTAMGAGLARYVAALADEGPVGLVAMGGSGAVTLVGDALRVLPIGVPKVLLTTMVETAAATLAGTDALVVPSVVDVSGLNSFSRGQLRRVATYLVGQVEHRVPEPGTGPLVAITMFGVTTRAATAARQVLEDAGCDVLVFHANGAGGRTMEDLVRAGSLDGVVDLTTTELADDLLGGKASAGPDRLRAAAVAGVPQVVSVGALDMANFGPIDEVPADVARGRRLYSHGPVDTLVRTSPSDCVELGRRLAERVRGSCGPAAVLLPEGGVSALSEAGGEFEDAAADAALVGAVRDGLRGSTVGVELVAAPLDSVSFGRAMARRLLGMLKHISETKAAQVMDKTGTIN